MGMNFHPVSGRLSSVLLALALIVSACGSGADSNAVAPTTAPDATASPATTGPSTTSTTTTSTTTTTTTSTTVPEPACTLSSGRATFEFDGEERSYRIALPDADEPVPLVLALHGFGYTADAHENQTSTEVVGVGAGFGVVTPDGLGTPARWHLEGSPIMALGGGVEGADSIAFADALVSHLLESGCFDSELLFATGFSNGGELSIQMACQGTSRLAGIGLVAGLNTRPACERDPLAVVAVSNVGDPNLPFEGGVLLGGPTVDSARDTIAAWAATNQCAADPAKEPSAELVNTVSYADCEATTLLHEVDWNAHVWPGAPEDPFWGAAPEDVSATQLMIDAFSAITSAS